MRPLSKKDIENILLPEEKILWHGYPDIKLMMRPFDVINFPFGIAFFSVPFFFYVDIFTSPGDFWASLFAFIFNIPIFSIGLYLSFGRFFIDSYKRNKTIYAVTTNRIIFLSKITKLKLFSLSIATLGVVGISEKKDGSGTILFGAKTYLSSYFNRHKMAVWTSLNSGPFVPSFEFIDDVRKVYNIIDEAKKNKRIVI